MVVLESQWVWDWVSHSLGSCDGVLDPVLNPLGAWLLAASLVPRFSHEHPVQDVTLGPEATAPAQP